MKYYSEDMSRAEHRACSGPCPIPPGERFENTVTAEKYLLYTKKKPIHLEGTCFDRDRNMYFTSTYEGAVIRVDKDTGEMTRLWSDSDLKASSVKIHADGRLFVTCLGTEKKSGRIVILDHDGNEKSFLAEGYDIDDMVFDHDGGIYFTHFIGSPNDPVGGIMYMPPELDQIEPFVAHLAGPNGVCLSTDESIMWITEFNAGRLLRVDMNTGFTTVAYHFTGFLGPDSISVDEEDNLYVAMFGQGRVMIFNKRGFPTGQILMPGRDRGLNMFTSHPMVHPDKPVLYITTADDEGDEGSWIMEAPAMACGNKNAYQFSQIENQK